MSEDDGELLILQSHQEESSNKPNSHQDLHVKFHRANLSAEQVQLSIERLCALACRRRTLGIVDAKRHVPQNIIQNPLLTAGSPPGGEHN